MSGGTWNYIHHEVQANLSDIADFIEEDFPLTARAIRGYTERLHSRLDALDKHYAGDARIKRTAQFDRETALELELWEE